MIRPCRGLVELPEGQVFAYSQKRLRFPDGSATCIMRLPYGAQSQGVVYLRFCRWSYFRQ